ncbi:hypothetical protein BC332_10430 [Capsicum chinense]|nr:hypothetical protein BC332_10430 [Capsicum chinense]
MDTPIARGKNLSLEVYPKTEKEKEDMSRVLYSSTVGSLMYTVMCTRPDICYVIGLVSRYKSNPGRDHWKAEKKIFRYLKGTADYSLCYSGSDLFIRDCIDIDWAGDRYDIKSTFGYAFLLNSVQEAVWLKRFFEHLNIAKNSKGPMILYGDSQAAIAYTKDPKYYTDDLSESNMIGSESFGSVYKGVLRSGTVNAVKVFNLQLDATFKSFDTECEVLRSLHHRNLVKVITSCSNLDFKALVLEYMPNGSLEKYLYSHNYFLDIRQRLSIMIAVTCALEYLHHGCLSPVIHCDLKPSNVLLDEDMVAHLSDFGISKLLGEDKGDLYTKTLATLGYIVPDTSLSVADYSFLFFPPRKRKPNEFEGDVSLKQWVSYSLPEAVMDIVDVNLEFSTLSASSADVSMKKLLSLSAKPLHSPVGRKIRLVHEHYNDVLAPYLFMRHDEIPQDFGNLSFLASLDLGRNNFHGNLPREMTRLHRVKFLDLSFNSFRGEVPSWFGLLHQLQFLSLRNNSFTGSIPSSFSNLSTLETLNVNFNSIEGHIPVSLSNASRLERLELFGNTFHGNIPEEIVNLHNMNWLSIQFNQFTGSIPLTVFNISRIEVISFRSNSLSGKLPNGLCSGLPILKALHLSFNKLHGDIPTSLSNCSQLQLLGLSENDFDGPIHSEIGRLTNLQRLACRYNHFTDIIL